MAKQPVPEHPVTVLVEDGDSKVIVDDSRSSPVEGPPIAAINKNEPIVTRRELWSYYCTSSSYMNTV